ncbi:MAG TPA: hypothetical protein VGG45_07955 [Terracidiphilus sp.]|jgi:hypothetical protein
MKNIEKYRKTTAHEARKAKGSFRWAGTDEDSNSEICEADCSLDTMLGDGNQDYFAIARKSRIAKFIVHKKKALRTAEDLLQFLPNQLRLKMLSAVPMHSLTC